jgi:hypothetical protein
LRCSLGTGIWDALAIRSREPYIGALPGVHDGSRCVSLPSRPVGFLEIGELDTRSMALSDRDSCTEAVTAMLKPLYVRVTVSAAMFTTRAR